MALLAGPDVHNDAVVCCTDGDSPLVGFDPLEPPPEATMTQEHVMMMMRQQQQPIRGYQMSPMQQTNNGAPFYSFPNNQQHYQHGAPNLYGQEAPLPPLQVPQYNAAASKSTTTKSKSSNRKQRPPASAAAAPGARSASERALFSHLQQQRQQNTLTEITNMAKSNKQQLPLRTQPKRGTAAAAKSGQDNNQDDVVIPEGAPVIHMVPMSNVKKAEDMLAQFRNCGDWTDDKVQELLDFATSTAKNNRQLAETVDILETNKDDGRRHATGDKEKKAMQKTHRAVSYRLYKFANEDDEKDLVMDVLYTVKHSDVKDADHKLVFFNTWRPVIASVLGAERSYVQGRVKESVVSFVQKHRVFPSFGWLEDLILRKDGFFVPPHTEDEVTAAKGADKKKMQDDLKEFANKIAFAQWVYTDLFSTYLPFCSIFIFVAVTLTRLCLFATFFWQRWWPGASSGRRNIGTTMLCLSTKFSTTTGKLPSFSLQAPRLFS